MHYRDNYVLLINGFWQCVCNDLAMCLCVFIPLLFIENILGFFVCALPNCKYVKMVLLLP